MDIYHILNWLAVLLNNRRIDFSGDVMKLGHDYVTSEYMGDYGNYDVIKGYRADDSCFLFARAFLNNSISLKTLNQAMYLGKLGEQIVLKSKEFFDRLIYIDSSTAHANIYFSKKIARDMNVRSNFFKFKKVNQLKKHS